MRAVGAAWGVFSAFAGGPCARRRATVAVVKDPDRVPLPRTADATPEQVAAAAAARAQGDDVGTLLYDDVPPRAIIAAGFSLDDLLEGRPRVPLGDLRATLSRGRPRIPLGDLRATFSLAEVAASVREEDDIRALVAAEGVAALVAIPAAHSPLLVTILRAPPYSRTRKELVAAGLSFADILLDGGFHFDMLDDLDSSPLDHMSNIGALAAIANPRQLLTLVDIFGVAALVAIEGARTPALVAVLRAPPHSKTCEALMTAGFSLNALLGGGFDATAARRAGVSLEKLRDAGVSRQECVAAGFKGATTANWDGAGHTKSITSVCTLADGRVVSASDDNTMRVWDAATGASQVLAGQTERVTSVCALADGRLVSGSWFKTLRVHDVATGASVELAGHTNWVASVCALIGGRIVSASGDKTLRVWDVARGACEGVLSGHTARVTSVCALAENRVVSGSGDGTLRVWDLATGSSDMLAGHTGGLTTVCALADGRIVSGSDDGTLRVWSLTTGLCELVLAGHTDWVTSVCALTDGRVVSASYDNTLRVWDAATGASDVLTGHTDVVTSVCALSDGRVVSASRDRALRVWDTATGACRPLTNTVYQAQLALAETRASVSGKDATFALDARDVSMPEDDYLTRASISRGLT